MKNKNYVIFTVNIATHLKAPLRKFVKDFTNFVDWKSNTVVPVIHKQRFILFVLLNNLKCPFNDFSKKLGVVKQ